MTTDDAKTYLSKREIPRLFESLMTGLMYHRPGDHIKYLIDCLNKVQEKGQENIRWSSFVDIRRSKTPLPPINGHRRPSSKGSRPSSHTRGVTPKEDAKTSSPPPDVSTANRVDLPDLPVVLVMGAPGSGKNSQVEKLLQRYPDWVHLNMGDLIRQEITTRGDAHAKWRMTRDLLNRGEPAPEDVTVEVLIKALMACSNAKGVIVNGFPRSMTQVTDYDKLVGRVDVVFMLDCDEQIATDRLLRRGKESSRPEDALGAIATRLNYFKSNTLPAAKHWDDRGKLVVIDGDVGEDSVEQDIGKAFDSLFFSKYGSTPLDTSRALKSAGSAPPPATYRGKWEKEDSTLTKEYPLFPGAIPPPASITVPDTGRKDGLPQCPIIFVAGGPGSGKGTQCERIVKRYSGFHHISMGDIIRDEISTKGTADDKWTMISQLVSKGEMAPEEVAIDLLKETLKKHMSAKAFVIEGFPRDKCQVESFNKHIGGVSFAMLFDCEEYFMQTRLMKRGKESGRIDDNLTAIANRINFYKHNTLPVLKHFDDIGKLVVRSVESVDADRDLEEMFYDISNLFDFALFGRKDGDLDDSQESAAVKIQANFRGYMVRSGKTSSSKEDKLSTDDEKLMAKAAKEQLKAGPRVKNGTISRQSDIQTTFHGFKKRTDVKIQKDEKNAKETIQAGFKGFKERKDILQAKGKKAKADEAVSQIQTSFKGFKSRLEAKLHSKDKQEIVKEGKAVSQIQAGFKGFKSRLEVKTQSKGREEKVKEDKAVSQIQASFKGFKSRKEVKKQRDEKNAKETIQAGFKGFKERKDKLQAKVRDDTKQDKAISQIQASFKGFKSRKELKKMKEATETIKAGVQGFMERMAISEEKDKKLEVAKDKEVRGKQISAVSLIQAGFKGFKSRLQSLAKKQAKEHVSLSEEEAQSRIQAGYHGYKSREQYQASNDDDNKQTTHEPIDDDEAALRIQAGYHGYKTRSKFKSSDKKGDDDDDDDDDGDEKEDASKDLDEAASRIQASYRGYKTRQKHQSSQAPKKESQVPVQEEVIEAAITTEGATVTGENIANPGYSAQLDQLAKQ